MKQKLTIQDKVFNIVNYTFLTAFTLICIVPFYYMFINTISDNTLVTRGLITWLPKRIHFNNYIQILKIDGLFDSVLVSVGRTVFGTLLTLLGTTFLGYAFSKPEFWKRKLRHPDYQMCTAR